MYLFELQIKLYEILSNLSCKVYDYVPKNAKCPYVEIGTLHGQDDSTKLNRGSKIYQNIDIYSEYEGKKEVKQIMQEVNSKLQNTIIKFEDASAFLYLDDFKIIEQEDELGKYNHGILIYKILIK